MKLNIAVLPGDGIGPEVIDAGLKVLHTCAEVFDLDITCNEALIGAVAIDETGSPLPEETLTICREADAILFGTIGHPKYDNDPSAKVRPEQGLLKLRKDLGLFSNIRPVKAFSNSTRFTPLRPENIEGVDMVIFRELTGGIYFGERTLSEDGKHASDLCAYSEDEILRVAKQAFEYARGRKKKLTLVDKANVLETSRLWRRVVTTLAADYPEVALSTLFVDNAAMQLILNPRQFDVILTENLFGDILSDEASVITGSLGMLPSASLGTSSALFEPIHGSYPQATGKNIANPLATILSVAMMFQHLQLPKVAAAIEKAVDDSINAEVSTEDLHPKKNHSTSEVADFICQKIQENVLV